MSDDVPTDPDGREAQPDHAQHAAQAADQAERLGQHRRPAGDDQGMGTPDEFRGDVGREEPYDEEPMAPEGPPA